MNAAVSIVLVAGFLIAYVNGANDVSKGIATLAGAGVTDYRRAIRWGASWTAVGGLAGGSLALAMVSTFGNGLLAPGTTPTFAAALAIILGATAWVLVATRTGLPVSTTHAIVGAMAGVGALAYGLHGVDWVAIGGKVVLPLLLSPVVALVSTMLLFRVAGGLGSPLAGSPDCACAEMEPLLAPVGASCASAAVLQGVRPRLTVGTREACAGERPTALRLTIDHVHWLTSGATSFARGMNDAPKIVALMLAASALSGGSPITPSWMFLVATLGMVVGSLVGGRQVTEVLAERVTCLDHRGGFIANLVTAAIVSVGAVGGLPMSTTHVSSGAIVAAGAERRAINWKTVREMALAWVVTLPAAGALGILVLALIGPG
jgi:PiT family inorganic phosphate transporter